MDNSPDFEYACGIEAAIGWCYEKLRDEGGVPKEEINPLIEQAFIAVMVNSSGCYATNEVAYRLAGMMLEKGDKVSAVKYYRKFLDTVKLFRDDSGGLPRLRSRQPQDSRVEAVKAKIAELEGTN